MIENRSFKLSHLIVTVKVLQHLTDCFTVVNIDDPECIEIMIIHSAVAAPFIPGD